MNEQGSIIRPLAEQVVVRQLEPPDVLKIAPGRAEVIAVGSGHLLAGGGRQELEVVPGDIVLFAPYAGTPITVGDAHYLIVNEMDILVVLATRPQKDHRRPEGRPNQARQIDQE